MVSLNSEQNTYQADFSRFESRWREEGAPWLLPIREEAIAQRKNPDETHRVAQDNRTSAGKHWMISFAEFKKALADDFDSAIEGFDLNDDEKSLIKAASEGCKESKVKLSEFLPDVAGQSNTQQPSQWYPAE